MTEVKRIAPASTTTSTTPRPSLRIARPTPRLLAARRAAAPTVRPLAPEAQAAVDAYYSGDLAHLVLAARRALDLAEVA